VALQRLGALYLAEKLGSGSEARRRRGLTRTQFCEYQRRLRTQGLPGLKDLPAIYSRHSCTTSAKAVTQVRAISQTRASWGWSRPRHDLKQQGVSGSSQTSQAILIKNRMASRYDSWFKLEEQAITLRAEQPGQTEPVSSCFRERRGSSKQAVRTEGGREFCGQAGRLVKACLGLNDIEHSRNRLSRPRSSGFVERFNRTFLDQDSRSAFRTKRGETISARRDDLDAESLSYHTERAHQNYRKFGKRPNDSILVIANSSPTEA